MNGGVVLSCFFTFLYVLYVAYVSLGLGYKLMLYDVKTSYRVM